MTQDYYAEALQSYGSSTPFSHWGAQLAHFPDSDSFSLENRVVVY